VGYDDFTEPATRLEEATQNRAIAEVESLIAELRALADRLDIPDDEDAAVVVDHDADLNFTNEAGIR
jgi:hypothetical protein